MLGIVKTINGVKQLVPLTTDSGQGLPLGAWTSFEDDKPRNGYLKAGTSFNQSDYPALYNMLGSNVVPERFDHDRLGAYQSSWVTIDSGKTFDYDGFVVIVTYPTTTNQYAFYLNGELIALDDIVSSGSGQNQTFSIPIHKGDVLTSTQTGAQIKWAYYTHPMFIKAVIGPIEDSAADQVVQNINNSRSYSTEEVNTGEKWIDGKPIYRKVFTGLNFGATLNVWNNIGVSIPDANLIISAYALRHNAPTNDNDYVSFYFRFSTDKNIQYYTNNGAAGCNTLVIEYTKTTD